MIALLLGIWLVPLLLLVVGGILFALLSNDESGSHCARCGVAVSPLATGICDKCLTHLCASQPKVPSPQTPRP